MTAGSVLSYFRQYIAAATAKDLPRLEHVMNEIEALDVGHRTVVAFQLAATLGHHIAGQRQAHEPGR